MRRQFVIWSGWLVAAVLMFNLGVQQVAGEVRGVPDASFVRGIGSNDGIVYALTTNPRVKIPLRITNVPTQVLNQAMMGTEAGTPDELINALSGVGGGMASGGTSSGGTSSGGTSGGGTQPPSNPPSAGAAPTNSLVGTSVTGCYGSARFYLEVTQADWLRTFAQTSPAGNGMWAVVIVAVTNQTRDSQVLANVVELRDDRGRNYKHSQNVDITTAAASIWGGKQAFDFYDPGITDYAVLPFEVAPDARSLRLVSSNFQCSS